MGQQKLTNSLATQVGTDPEAHQTDRRPAPAAAEPLRLPDESAGGHFIVLAVLEENLQRLDEADQALAPPAVQVFRKTDVDLKALAMVGKARRDNFERVVEYALQDAVSLMLPVAAAPQERGRERVAGEKAGGIAAAVQAEIKRIVRKMATAEDLL